MADLESEITQLWEARDSLAPNDGDALKVVDEAIELLDSGQARVAEFSPGGQDVVVHQWLKQAILLLFRLSELSTSEVGPFEYVDRIPLKVGFERAGVRAVPGAIARRGSFLDRGVILMPSYTNIGARVGAESMVDTWATVGSCAQIGERVHLSGGVGIGGVLEPAQASPVMIGDDAFIGSRAMIVEGARVGDGAVVGAGVILTPSIAVVDSETGQEYSRGVVPPWSVVINASRRKEFPGGEFFTSCALIIKRLSEGERHDKAQLNEILRAHGVAT